MYDDEEMLMLSGIQHFVFCPRQWGLIHIEQVWEDNKLTVEGTLMHARVDDALYRQLNNGVITLRHVALASHRLGVYGFSDAIELKKTEDELNAIRHPRYPGLWMPYPVEFKHGHAKQDLCDILQLAAQVMCIEDMYNIHLMHGGLFYWKTRRREEILIDLDIREQVVEILGKMHELMKKGTLPKAVPENKCKSCSLRDICEPNTNSKNAQNYLKEYLYEENA